MDNNEKFKNLIDESFKYPVELSQANERFEKRILKENRKKKTILSSAAVLTASLLFVVLININPSFANAVADIPVIGKLADYLKFDKSLSKAIENEYVQEVNLVSFDGEKQLNLPYLIADEKNLVLFFQISEELKQKSDESVNIYLKDMKNPETGEKIEGYFYSIGDLSLEGRQENFGFMKHHYQFVDISVPKSIDMKFELKLENATIGIFDFNVELEDFAEPKVYEIHEKHTIFDQDIEVEKMTVYPTGTEVDIKFSGENSAIIKGLELMIKQDEDDGESIDYNLNKMAATYNDKWMRVFIESNYFDKAKKQDLLITGITLLDKNEEFVTVDIDNKTIRPEIEGTELEQVVKEGDKASLVFSSPLVNDVLYSMFAMEYKDEDGNIYELDSIGTGSESRKMKTFITVKYPDSGKIILQRDLTPTLYLDKPIKIELPRE